jgi:hypothetical protein
MKKLEAERRLYVVVVNSSIIDKPRRVGMSWIICKRLLLMFLPFMDLATSDSQSASSVRVKRLAMVAMRALFPEIVRGIWYRYDTDSSPIAYSSLSYERVSTTQLYRIISIVFLDRRRVAVLGRAVLGVP